MKEIAWKLVDLRAEIKAALQAEIAEDLATVRQRFPRAPEDGVIVTYGEFDNHSTNCPVVDEVTYQIDIWAFDRQTVRELSGAVNRAMLRLGMRRSYSGPDGVVESRYERKTFRFGRKIDKRWMRMMD